MRSYLFLDGGAIRASFKSLAEDLKEPSIELDFRAVGRDFDRVFYFDGMPSRRTDQPEDEYRQKLDAKEAELLALSLQPKVHIRTGTTRYRKRKEGGFEQKGVDVLIAIDMLRYASQGHMDHATLWSSRLLNLGLGWNRIFG